MRVRLAIYLLVIHLVFVGALVIALENHVAWIIGLEVFTLLSAGAGFGFIRTLGRHRAFVKTGADLLAEEDFTARFRPTGIPETDALVDVYNRMADHLREERVRLQELNLLLDRLIEASPSGIITCDFDGRIALVNPKAEQILGRAASSLVGWQFSELGTPFGRSLDALPVGSAGVLPLQGRRRIKCAKAHFMDRGFPRTFVMLEELTEELRQSEKAAYEKLIRMMSHEVGNTTGAVTSLLQSSLTLSERFEGEDREDFEMALRVAIARAESLDRFVRGFAEVIRLPAPQLRSMDLVQLLRELQVLFEPECRRREITWAWEVDGPVPAIRADPYQMERALVNILKNAVEAVESGGLIAVCVDCRQGWVCLEIENTGPGLSDEVRQHLFTPFYSTKENGRGLGLTLVQEVLSRHGFDFTLEGGPGEPTRFSIRIPEPGPLPESEASYTSGTAPTSEPTGTI